MENLPIIKGEKVYLGPMPETNEFCLKYLEWLNSERVKLGTGDSEEYNLDSVKELFSEWRKDKKNWTFCIYDKENNEEIGDICIRDEGDEYPEILIMIGKSFGKGRGSEAMKLLLNYGFCELNYNQIALTVYKDNAPAVRLYLKLGFKITEERKDEGRDEFYMILDKEEWGKLK